MKRIFILSVMLVVSLFAGGVQAQASSAPIIMIANGNLWAWSEGASELRPLAHSRYIQEMNVSPDGSKVAYTGFAEIVVTAIEREGGFGGGTLADDIWVVDIASGSASPIAAQPPDASFATPNVADKYLVRSRPVWSPDGTKLAWAEYADVSGDPQQLMVYDFATGQAAAVVSGLPVPFGIPAPEEVIGWTGSGIVLHNVIYVPGQLNNTQDMFMVYSSDGTPVSSTVLPQGETRFLSADVLLTDNQRDYLAIRYNTGEWDLLDLHTGSIQPAATTPELYSADNPDTSVAIYENYGGVNQSSTLQIMDAQGNPLGGLVPVGFSAIGAIAISPDGQTVAFHNQAAQSSDIEQVLTLWRGGQAVAQSPVAVQGETVFMGAFAWGRTAWRLSHVLLALPPTPTPFECPGALPTRLAVGNLAQVTQGGGPNNWRETPGLNGTLIGQIPEGGTFSVAEGPICADGLVWWKVYYNGSLGWTVEGQNGVYYLEKIS